MGDALGLYKSLHAGGCLRTVSELAATAGVNERYLPRANCLSYDPATKKFTLPEEEVMVFAIDDSPVRFSCPL